MAGCSVHFARIHHHGVGARLYSSSKCREKVLTQSILRDKRGAPVSTRSRVAITHIVFQRGRNTAWARKITALIPTNGGHSHHRREISILAECLPQARPQRLPSGVEHRRKCPWNAGLARLRGRDLTAAQH